MINRLSTDIHDIKESKMNVAYMNPRHTSHKNPDCKISKREKTIRAGKSNAQDFMPLWGHIEWRVRLTAFF